jgi:hypothetical protein
MGIDHRDQDEWRRDIAERDKRMTEVAGIQISYMGAATESASGLEIEGMIAIGFHNARLSGELKAYNGIFPGDDAMVDLEKKANELADRVKQNLTDQFYK